VLSGSISFPVQHFGFLSNFACCGKAQTLYLALLHYMLCKMTPKS